MNALSPIPTPPALRWREFRIKVVPGVVFVALSVVAVVLWTTHVMPPTLVGQVEALQANVSSAKPGLLTQLTVERFKTVRVGDPIAMVITTDPKVIESSLAVIKAEVELLRLSMDPLQDRLRNELSFERFRLDWLERRLLLASAQVRQHYAEAEFQRIAELFHSQTNLVSKTEYDVAFRDQETARVEVGQLTKMVEEVGQAFQRLQLADPAKAPSPTDTLRAAIAVQEEKLRLTEAQLRPLTLTAPITGMVSMVYRRAGENIIAGEPVLTITSDQAERIVAYLRQPLGVEPAVGMAVRITTRSLRRTTGVGKVQKVGAYMEPIPRNLVPPVNAQAVEYGLPISISVPVALRVRPGEPVDGAMILPAAKLFSYR